MKKRIFFRLLTLTSVIGLVTSCSKTYNCHCVYKTNGTITHEENNKVNEGKRERSEAACNNMNSSTTTNLNGYTSVNTVECELN